MTQSASRQGREVIIRKKRVIGLYRNVFGQWWCITAHTLPGQGVVSGHTYATPSPSSIQRIHRLAHAPPPGVWATTDRDDITVAHDTGPDSGPYDAKRRTPCR